VELPFLVSSIDILPAIVEYNIVVSQISQTQPENLLRGSVEKIFRNIATESVPVVLFAQRLQSVGCPKILKGHRTHPIGGVTASPLFIAAAPLKRAVAITILL
jgi:hypothetical protein